MKHIERDIVSIAVDTFHDKFQNKLDWLNANGEKFQIEEYYNDSLTVFVLQKEIYIVKILEQCNRKICGIINQVDNIAELYPYMRKNRIISDLAELREVSLKIQNRYKELCS